MRVSTRVSTRVSAKVSARVVLWLWLVFACYPSIAQEQHEQQEQTVLQADTAQQRYPLATAVERKRFHELSQSIACPTCDGSAIGESNSQIAEKLRYEIWQRIRSGDSDIVIREWLKQHYGDEIFLNPEMRIGTLMLWIVPLLAMVIGLFMWSSQGRKASDDVS